MPGHALVVSHPGGAGGEMIRIVVFEEAVQNGGRLTGRVDAASPATIECRWWVEAKGRRRQEVVGRVEQIDFGFEIPIFGPLSYDGKLLRIGWEIAARADGGDEVVQPFTVVPRRWDPAEWAGVDD